MQPARAINAALMRRLPAKFATGDVRVADVAAALGGPVPLTYRRPSGAYVMLQCKHQLCLYVIDALAPDVCRRLPAYPDPAHLLAYLVGELRRVVDDRYGPPPAGEEAEEVVAAPAVRTDVPPPASALARSIVKSVPPAVVARGWRAWQTSYRLVAALGAELDDKHVTPEAWDAAHAEAVAYLREAGLLGA